MIDYKKMETMNVRTLVIKMFIPVLISLLALSGYFFIQNFFLEGFSPTDIFVIQIAAPLLIPTSLAIISVEIAIRSSIGRALGENDQALAGKIGEHGFLLALIIFNFFAIRGSFFVEKNLQLFNSHYELIGDAAAYARIMLIFSFFRIFNQLGISILQAYGEMVKPMISHIIGLSVAAILSFILMSDLFLPALGIKGLAIAAVTGQGFSMIFTFVILHKNRNIVLINFRNFVCSWKILSKILIISVPLFFSEIFFYLYSFYNTSIMAKFSSLILAASNSFDIKTGVLFIPLFAMILALFPIVAYNIGARKRERIKEVLRFSLLLSLAYVLIIVICIQLFPGFIFSYGESSIEMDSSMKSFFRIKSLMFPFAVILLFANMLFQIMAKSYYTLLLKILEIFLLALTLTILIKNNFNVTAVYWIYPLMLFIVAFSAVFLLKKTYSSFTGKWKSDLPV